MWLGSQRASRRRGRVAPGPAESSPLRAYDARAFLCGFDRRAGCGGAIDGAVA